MVRLKISLSLTFLSFIFGGATSCSKNENYVKAEGIIWNTAYHITYKGPDNLKDSILPLLNQVGKSLSVFDKTSLVTKLNNGTDVKADYHLIKVYDESLRINRLSNGLFDPTVSPLIDAWGFGIGHTPNQDTIAIDSVMQFIGISKTYRNGSFIIKKDPRIKFNFSAIAKGYGCDAVGEMFKRNGVSDFMVEIGGEISLSGKSPSGNDWVIAIDAPIEDKNPGEETALILSISDVAIATSGNYRNYRKDGENKTGHTISPKTGRPFIGEILSATAIAENCMEADALATACMAGSFDEAKTLLEKSNTLGVIILSDSVWVTPELRKFILK